VKLTCNHLAIDSETRIRYEALRNRLDMAGISCSELADGYVFQLDERLISCRELSEWMRIERLCCPFLSLETGTEQFGALELRLTGPSGSKAVLLSEFRELLESKNGMRRRRCKE
jgi:hypothetical protein